MQAVQTTSRTMLEYRRSLVSLCSNVLLSVQKKLTIWGFVVKIVNLMLMWPKGDKKKSCLHALIGATLITPWIDWGKCIIRMLHQSQILGCWITLRWWTVVEWWHSSVFLHWAPSCEQTLIVESVCVWVPHSERIHWVHGWVTSGCLLFKRIL